MPTMDGHADRPDAPRLPARRRGAALGALVCLGALVLTVLATVIGDVLRVLANLVLLGVLAMALWSVATRRHQVRLVAALVALGSLTGFVVLTLTGEGRGALLLVSLLLVAASTGLTKYALRRDRNAVRGAPTPGAPVAAARRPVLILNLRSGGGKAEQFHLVDECRARGIEAVVLEEGDDLLHLAEDALDRGADVIGMAGGDGSQALVATVASRRGVPMVCIPAGTRNHFALDLGLDRDDVVGSLDAFGPAVERTIDLATVNGRVFVNNVSLGVYAKIVQSAEYRDAKGQTAAKLLPDLVGPEAEPFVLRFTGPEGEPHDAAHIIQVSNNPYQMTGIDGFGSRARLDTGRLGVVTAEVSTPADAAALVAAQLTGHPEAYAGYLEWTTPTFVVASDGPVEAGVDGEALLLDPPVEFRIQPGALRVRIPRDAPGYSPAALAPPSWSWTIGALFRAAAGHPTPIDESRR